jgi:hypothetical protein
MRRCLIACLLIALALWNAPRAAAQTTMPVGKEGMAEFELPAGWVRTSDLATSQGFRPGVAGKIVSTFHPEGSRPTDLPYAVIEHIGKEPVYANVSMYYTVPRVAGRYAQAMDPPSKADRAGTWKSARVTTPQWSGNNFTFRVAIDYVGGISGNKTYYVSVIGHFEDEGTTILSTWTDSDARTAHRVALDALSSNGIRAVDPKRRVPHVSFQERLVSTAKISGVILILFVVGVQLWVIVRERRQRQAEEAAWREPLV